MFNILRPSMNQIKIYHTLEKEIPLTHLAILIETLRSSPTESPVLANRPYYELCINLSIYHPVKWQLEAFSKCLRNIEGPFYTFVERCKLCDGPGVRLIKVRSVEGEVDFNGSW